jgi:hypothetical protein
MLPGEILNTISELKSRSKATCLLRGLDQLMKMLWDFVLIRGVILSRMSRLLQLLRLQQQLRLAENEANVIHTVLIDCIKAASCLIGAGILYIGCFLYPDEENKLQNRVEEFWIGIDERRRFGTSLALASRVACLIDGMLNLGGHLKTGH